MKSIKLSELRKGNKEYSNKATLELFAPFRGGWERSERVFAHLEDVNMLEKKPSSFKDLKMYQNVQNTRIKRGPSLLFMS